MQHVDFQPSEEHSHSLTLIQRTYCQHLEANVGPSFTLAWGTSFSAWALQPAWQPLLWWSDGYMMYVDMIWLFHLHTFFSINSHLTGLSNIARASSCRTAAVFRATTSWTNLHCSYYAEAYRSNLSTWKRMQSCQKLSFDSDLWAQTVNCSPNLAIILSHSGQVSRISGHGWISKEFPKTECMSAAATWHQKPWWAPTRPLLLTSWFQACLGMLQTENLLSQQIYGTGCTQSMSETRPGQWVGDASESCRKQTHGQTKKKDTRIFLLTT